jgi:heme/copper-type cytochrome/quinol oxidase subunit 1
MILATIIRLEMAYPGVGILAGDSLQYLSVVTAHAVIMVFFMIMPLIFGAFGNFLLPTQLGVHDVAFPRLNSAAFWFLPGGLLMLCQLVCLDRRYQRMNCFNIREVEALLKGRFFPDLVNTHDHRLLVTNSTLGLRFKTNNLDTINHATLLFHQYGLQATNQSRYTHFFLNGTTLGSSYEFSPNGSLKALSVEVLLRYCFSVPLFLTSLLPDMAILVTWIFSPSHSSHTSTRRGFLTHLEFCHFWVLFFKSEVERQWLSLFNLFSCTRSSNYYSSWLGNFKLGLLNKFLYGYMQNSISTYYLLTRDWPEARDPQIITDDTFPAFYVTATDQLCSRSIFLYMEVFWSNFFNTIITVTCGFIDSVYKAFSYLVQLPSTFISYDWFDFLRLDAIFLALRNIPGLFPNQSLLGAKPSLILFSELENYSLPSASLTFTNLLVNRFSASLGYTNQPMQVDSLKFSSQNLLIESTLDMRYQRNLNPIFRYDYKLGNYFTKEDSIVTPYLFTTISELTGGIRKSSWFFSKKFLEIFKDNFQSYKVTYGVMGSTNGSLANPYIQSTFPFYNFLTATSGSFNFFQARWAALTALDQKFNRMFLTSSAQQRIFSNWRQLKFTREAWRCKLLAARHQKTLYRRYTEEDGIFWAIERNAKDVLPGWAMITPFSARTRFTAIGKVDIGLMGVFLVLNSSIVSSANFLVTYRYLSTLNNRKMRDARSFFTEGVMVASWMMIAANPMLVIGILMLLSDRHWQTSFFDYSGGGDTVLFQHMFWFFGHPEVYVIMIPAFGFNNTILSFYLRKRVSARASLLYSMYTIAFLGFFVWGHHMYMVGLSHTTRMLFSTLTVMISVPAATKLMHWCVTLANSSFAMELPMFFMLLFIFFFVSGGISGMAVANTGMDILFHDTFYVVGHFHVMFAGSAMFASFGAFYFYFPSIFGVKYSRIYGYLHCLYYLIGQLMTVTPMIWLGYSGMPRRVLDYPASLGGWHAIVSAGHLLSVAGLMAFFIMIFDSLRQARAVTRNTFGITRFNTRLNFYLYEVARNKFIQRKGWYISRANNLNKVHLNKFEFSNFEVLESSVYAYAFKN